MSSLVDKVVRRATGVTREEIPETLVKDDVASTYSKYVFITSGKELERPSTKWVKKHGLMDCNGTDGSIPSLLVLTRTEVMELGLQSMTGWVAGCTYQRHEDCTTNLYVPHKNWNDLMSNEQLAVFRQVCLHGGVKTVDVVNDLRAYSGVNFSVETDVGPDAVSLAGHQSLETQALSQWRMRMTRPQQMPKVAQSVRLSVLDRSDMSRQGLARGGVGGGPVQNTLVDIIKESVEVGHPVVKDLLVRIQRRVARTRGAEASVGVQGVGVGAAADTASEVCEDLFLYITMWPKETYDGMNPDFTLVGPYLPNAITNINALAEECLKLDEDVSYCPCFGNYETFFLMVGKKNSGKSTFVHNIVRALSGVLDPTAPVNRNPPTLMSIRGLVAEVHVGGAPILGDGTSTTRRFPVVENVGPRRGKVSFIDTVGLTGGADIDAARKYKDFLVGMSGESTATPLFTFITFDVVELHNELVVGESGDADVKELMSPYVPFAELTTQPVMVLLTKIDMLEEQLGDAQASDAALSALSSLAQEVFSGCGVECITNLTVPTQEEMDVYLELATAASQRRADEKSYKTWTRSRSKEHDVILNRLERTLNLALAEARRQRD